VILHLAEDRCTARLQRARHSGLRSIAGLFLVILSDGFREPDGAAVVAAGAEVDRDESRHQNETGPHRRTRLSLGFLS